MINKILNLLTPYERRRGYLLLVLIFLMAFMEVVGVASIMPFMSVLAKPEVVHTNTHLAAIYNYLGFEQQRSFLIFLGVVFFLIFVTSVAVKAVTTYATLRFTYMRTYTISRRLVASYLRQPYEWFLNHHSADLGKTILTEVQQVVVGTLIPLLQMIAQMLVAACLIVLLLLVNPMLAITVAVSMGLIYAGIYYSLRGYLGRIGAERVNANQERFQVVQETFGGIKDVKVSGLELSMLERYQEPARRYAYCEAASQLASQLPRFALEAIAFGGMLLVVVYLISGEGGLKAMLPLIALYAFAGYKLMPALQQIYMHISRMRFSAAALNSLQKDMLRLDMDVEIKKSAGQKECLELSQALLLEEISYTYPNSTKSALSGLSVTIPAKSTIALVGTTGSGKTTTVDIILGLLKPQSGKIIVDGKQIVDDNLRQWQNSIGYVPQHIYLADDTILANIAFGVPPDNVNQDAVKQAARIANLHDFVINELPDGYQSMVGERGVRLSGGQRQRIGIARALYHNPEVLILDEATSALDNLTEQAVMEAVHNLGHKKTIIMIAHRLTTVQDCDKIYMLENGKVTGSGTYNELVDQNSRFRAMATGSD
ncbi:MAG: ABC transporter ATP-binding protein [Gammaproteobacteria bacterium]